MNFRHTIAGGDLILQRLDRGAFRPPMWSNYRNLDEEVRLLAAHERAAREHYLELKRLHEVASRNVKDIKEMIQFIKVDNAQIEFYLPVELSILEEREGVKYGGHPDKGNGGNNNQNSNKGGENKDGNNNKDKNNNGGKKALSLFEVLANAKITVH